jgi:hypothetical protein
MSYVSRRLFLIESITRAFSINSTSKDLRQSSNIQKTMSGINTLSVDLSGNPLGISGNSKIDNLHISTRIAAQFTAKNSNTDDIVAAVKKEMEAKYPESISKDDLKKLVEGIKSYTDQKIDQSATAHARVDVRGPGTEVNDVTMNTEITAVMNALAKIDDKTGIDLLNKLVEQQMLDIKQNVDKQVVGGFTAAWQEGKKTFIELGLYLLALVLVMVFLILYKAAHH